ncbi:MAG TPA: electron transfer flavoprotein beta subunit/FixA family protein [Planctomycetes bacterium]|nr:electron transfer flavoprotein beta subunit/FixA family protein [Planctomycetota bacterium]HIL37154.1 electron transfer flavoprotein beta subunit/FixA family protein [Planctomycetota bacterium]
MNIVACVKRVPNTEAVVKVADGGTSLDESGLSYMISFYDELAIEEAVRTKEAHGGEVTVLTLGPSEGTKEIRECLAKGGDRAELLADSNWLSRDCRASAKALAAKLSDLGADVAFMGRVATDRDNAAVGPMVATYLGWACVTDVVSLEIAEDKGTARRETETGIETIEFSLPAVITCNKGLNEPRYSNLKGIMAAKKKPFEESPAELVDNQASVIALTPPSPRAEGRILGTGPDAVPVLIDALRNEAKVI